MPGGGPPSGGWVLGPMEGGPQGPGCRTPGCPKPGGYWGAVCGTRRGGGGRVEGSCPGAPELGVCSWVGGLVWGCCVGSTGPAGSGALVPGVVGAGVVGGET